MKKVLFSTIAFVIISASITSCNKCYTCVVNNTNVDYCNRDNSQTQIDAAKTACVASGGTWQ